MALTCSSRRWKVRISFLSALVFFYGFGSIICLGAFAADLNTVELQYARSGLTSGYQDWNDVSLLNYFGQQNNRFIVETDYKNHFGEGAAVIGLTYTRTYNQFWYQDFSTTFSTNNAVVPGFVIFTELHRKVLSDQSLVLGFGVGHNVSQNPYTDTYALLEANYYWIGPLSVQTGIRANESSPGNVTTTRVYGSINYLNDRWDAFLRYETGREGYTVVGQNNFKNEFSSKDESIQIHYYLKSDLGFGVKFDWYQSQYYDRNQISLDLMLKY